MGGRFFFYLAGCVDVVAGSLKSVFESGGLSLYLLNGCGSQDDPESVPLVSEVLIGCFLDFADFAEAGGLSAMCLHYWRLRGLCPYLAGTESLCA